MNDLLRVCVVLSVIAAPGVALAQCTKDTDCKGDRVCERGKCVTPAERTETPPVPPPQQPTYEPPPPATTYTAPPPARPARPHNADASWEAYTRKNLISINVLSTVGAALTANSSAAQQVYPGLNIFQAAFTYERAIIPHLSVVGTLTPNVWVASPLPSGYYAGVTAGVRAYPFGTAPNGWWAGGEIGWLPLNDGFGLEAQTGWQWLFEGGFTLGVAGVVNLYTKQDAATPVDLALNGYVGWNF